VPESTESLRAENARLRARIRELEAEAPRRSRLEVDEETADISRDLPGRAMNEANRVMRAAILASLEQLRVGAEAVDTFASEVFRRNRPETRTSVNEMAFNLPADVYSGVIRALDRTLDTPARVVQKFFDSYRESERVQTERERKRPSSTPPEPPETAV